MRILVIRYGFIGDCVMVAQALSGLRLANPDAHIEWMVARGIHVVIDTDVLANHLIKVVRRLSSRSPNPRYQLDKYRAISRIRNADYDAILNFENPARYLPADLNFIQMPLFHGWFDRSGYRSGDLLTEAYNSPSPHYVDICKLELRKHFEMVEDADCIMPPIPSKAQTLKGICDSGDSVATISVGTSKEDKNYPTAAWATVGTALESEGYRVIFVGGKRDRSPRGIGIDLVGKTSLRQTMALIRHSTVHLSCDTGTGHIAAAYGTPVVSLFGPTDPILHGPYSNRRVILTCGHSVPAIPPEQAIESALELANTSYADAGQWSRLS